MSFLNQNSFFFKILELLSLSVSSSIRFNSTLLLLLVSRCCLYYKFFCFFSLFATLSSSSFICLCFTFIHSFHNNLFSTFYFYSSTFLFLITQYSLKCSILFYHQTSTAPRLDIKTFFCKFLMRCSRSYFHARQHIHLTNLQKIFFPFLFFFSKCIFQSTCVIQSYLLPMSKNAAVLIKYNIVKNCRWVKSY